ncbi:hypothetical protein L2E82_46981 [Cichorium intybus]|uniref:Uncharacterized protein n=1 Tax=Cichorium intybus TaxID=13427 RepID=A0ACB8YUR3_CICIN|nr:hypothetical protein L2E82_46981 [Cichorium intybus]
MAMKNTTTDNSLKSLCFVIGIIIFLFTTEINVVDCRALRSTQLITVAVPVTGLEKVYEAEDTGKTEYMVSSFNLMSGSSVKKMRNLAYKLASGPSKRGPGIIFVVVDES